MATSAIYVETAGSSQGLFAAAFLLPPLTFLVLTILSGLALTNIHYPQFKVGLISKLSDALHYRGCVALFTLSLLLLIFYPFIPITLSDRLYAKHTKAFKEVLDRKPNAREIAPLLKKELRLSERDCLTLIQNYPTLLRSLLDETGLTPDKLSPSGLLLFTVIEKGYEEGVDLLLNRGATLSIRYPYKGHAFGCTPLHFAAGCDLDPEVAGRITQRLLATGLADPNALDGRNMKPLDWAKLRHNDSLIRLLS